MGPPYSQGGFGGPCTELCPPLQLRDLQEKYTECGGMLQEAQEEVKSLRSRSLPNSTVSRYGAPSLLPVVSPAAGFGWWGGLRAPPPFPNLHPSSAFSGLAGS